MKKKKERKNEQAENNNPVNVVTISNPEKWKYYGVLAIIVMISGIAYLPVLHNSFINWDDNLYIRDNPLIYSFNLKEIFLKNVASNYHPLTILTLALEYHLWGLNETGYHSVNLLLHLLNVVLVFNTIFLLSNKAVVALVASLLFGIHPIHVESVAWVAELKDLLYTFFFLASYIFYLKYLKNQQGKFYVFAILLFLLSLLSKAMAASLPFVLVLTDYFMGKKLNAKTILEKVPFFLLALVLGIVAVVSQKATGATEMIVFPFQDRILFASYGFITYLYKLILPLHLSAYYPYPVKPGSDIPLMYYTYVVFLIGLFAFVFYSLRYSKKIIFGFGFFAFTVFLVLQLLPVGRVIMADRYSYIPSIGIFYLAGEGFNLLYNQKGKLIFIIGLSAFTIFFSTKTYARSAVWKNSLTLWNDVINQYQTIPSAYNNRSLAYKIDKKYDKALEDCSKAILLDKNYAEAYINRANIYRDMNKFAEAMTDYNMAIELKPNFEKAYINRGILFLFEKREDEALIDFNKSIDLNPNFAESYYHQGLVYYNKKKYEEAITSYGKAIQLRPKYAEAYFSRGVSKFYTGKKDAACQDLIQASSLGYQIPADVFSQICK